jgi:hypothetical protein
MRIVISAVIFTCLLTTPTRADGMSKADVARAKGQSVASEADLPAPQPSVIVTRERGVRVWRPVVDAPEYVQPTESPVYAAVQPPYADQSAATGYANPAGYGSYGSYGGLGTNGIGHGKNGDGLNGVGVTNARDHNGNPRGHHHVENQRGEAGHARGHAGNMHSGTVRSGNGQHGPNIQVGKSQSQGGHVQAQGHQNGQVRVHRHGQVTTPPMGQTQVRTQIHTQARAQPQARPQGRPMMAAPRAHVTARPMRSAAPAKMGHAMKPAMALGRGGGAKGGGGGHGGGARGGGGHR